MLISLLLLVLMATEVVDLQARARSPWVIVNDGVMGGLSRGQVTVSAGRVVRFEGNLSLENNGGFSSARVLLRDGLGNAERITLRVRGDGRRYQLRLRYGRGLDGVAWRSGFDTTANWQSIELSLADLEPVFRGRVLANEGSIVPADVRQVGFLLADGLPGEFWLEVADLVAVGN